MECQVGKHGRLDFKYDPIYGIPIIICRACGQNLSREVLDGIKSKTELRAMEEQAKARRTTKEEVLDRLAWSHERDRLNDPQLRRLVEERKKRLERNRK